MRLIFILFVILSATVPCEARKHKAKHKTHNHVLSEVKRKALARRQVAHARYIASLQKQQEEKEKNKIPEFKANDEVTIRDYGFEQPAKPDFQETATVKSEDIKIEDEYVPIQDDPGLGWNTVSHNTDM